MTDRRTASLTVGRDTHCDIVVDDVTVSARHAEVMLTRDGDVFVTDCGSTNGTFVIRDGDRCKVRQELVDGDDEVLFGECRFTLPTLIREIRIACERVDEVEESMQFVRCACGHVRARGAVCHHCGTGTQEVSFP